MTGLRAIAAVAIALTTVSSVPGRAGTDEPLWREVYGRQTARPLDPSPVVVAGDGVTVTFEAPPPQRLRSQGWASLGDARVVVQFEGTPSFELPKDGFREAAFGLWVGIGRMAEDDSAPTVIVTGYTGGAHCCLTFQAVTLVAGRPVSVDLPRIDAAGADFGFPSDLDGDGVRDILWSDNSLLYAFTSYAGSRPVPRIFNLRRGELVDVSRSPGFAAIYREFAGDTLEACRTGRWENAGACAAYAYAMAVQGDPETGIRTAVQFASKDTLVPSECNAELVRGECPEGEEVDFPGFEAALRRKMEQNGYLP